MSQDEPPPHFDDDSNAISLDQIKKIHPLDDPTAKIIPPPSDDEDGPPAGPVWSGPMPSKMQSAIQSSSTPTYHAQRYLCWNSIGIVKGIVNEEKGLSLGLKEMKYSQTSINIFFSCGRARFFVKNRILIRKKRHSKS